MPPIEAFKLPRAWIHLFVISQSLSYRVSRSCRITLQMARASINERIHLRLWRTDKQFQGQQLWIGQISRDIGVRFTPKTWNLTTHKIDDDVDEARDYVADFLLSSGNVSEVGYAAGVGAASATASRRNLTGDPYHTDGRRVVLVLSRSKTSASFLDCAGNSA